MRRLLLLAVTLFVIPGVAYAGGGGVDTSGCPGYSEGDTVSMRDSCFSGTAHFAPTGTITVTNAGSLPHTLTAVDGSFDTGEVGAGSSAEIAVAEPGIYRVFCGLHGTAEGEGMAGVLVVGEAEPASVLLPTDTAAITEAVAAENGRILSAVHSAHESIQNLNATETRLLLALDEVVPGEEIEPGEASSPPSVVVTPVESSPRQLVTTVMVGLAAGLALAALLAVLHLRIANRSAERLETLQPSVRS